MYICKKKPKNGGEYTFIWIAIDRDTGNIIDFEVGDRTNKTYFRLAIRIKERYNIENLCTDGYKAYDYIKIAKHHHKSKSETCLIESVNSRIRNYLARFNRRTKRYSKSIRMIKASLILFFYKHLLNLNFHL